MNRRVQSRRSHMACTSVIWKRELKSLCKVWKRILISREEEEHCSIMTWKFLMCSSLFRIAICKNKHEIKKLLWTVHSPFANPFLHEEKTVLFCPSKCVWRNRWALVGVGRIEKQLSNFLWALVLLSTPGSIKPQVFRAASAGHPPSSSSLKNNIHF